MFWVAFLAKAVGRSKGLGSLFWVAFLSKASKNRKAIGRRVRFSSQQMFWVAFLPNGVEKMSKGLGSRVSPPAPSVRGLLRHLVERSLSFSAYELLLRQKRQPEASPRQRQRLRPRLRQRPRRRRRQERRAEAKGAKASAKAPKAEREQGGGCAAMLSQRPARPRLAGCG